jgi:hypothetical protein
MVLKYQQFDENLLKIYRVYRKSPEKLKIGSSHQKKIRKNLEIIRFAV